MKLLLKIIVGLVVLLVVVVAGFLFTFDANNYKQDIVDQVEQQTGREFTIAGDIQFTIIPWIGLKVEKVALGNAEGFSQVAFAKIDQLEVKVQLMPLLKKELNVDKVRLHGLALSLETNEQGGNNWSDFSQKPADPSAGSSAEPLTTTDTTPEPASIESGTALAGLAVNGIELVGAMVNWSDAQSGMKATISGLTLKTGAIEFDEPVAVEFSADVESNQPNVKAKISMQTEIQFNQALDIFDIEAFQFNAVTSLEDLTQTPITLKLKTNAHIDLNRGTAQLSDTQIGAMNAVINAGLNITDLTTQPVIKGVISSDVVNVRELAEKLQIALPPMANPQSLTKVSMYSRVEATPASVHLDDFKITLDDSLLSGWLHLPDIAQPKVRYKLKLNPIVLDGYLPPVAETTVVNVDPAIPVSEDRAAVDTPISLPIDLLRTLDLDGVLDIERVTAKDTIINMISIPVKVAHGIVIINPATMIIFDGTINAKLGLDVRTVPAYVIDIKGNNLKAGTIMNPILAGMMGDQKVTMQGDAKFDVSVKAGGNSVLALKKSAKGKIQIDMNQATLNGVDLEYFVHQKVADYVDVNKVPFIENFRDEYRPKSKTAFDRFHASFAVAQGKLTNKDLILDSKDIKVTGSGVVNIIDESISYRPVLDYKVKNPATTTDKLKDIPMEFYVHGPFSALIFDFNKSRYFKDAGDVFKEKAREKIKKEVDKKKEEEKEKTREKLKQKGKDLLKGLFK